VRIRVNKLSGRNFYKQDKKNGIITLISVVKVKKAAPDSDPIFVFKFF
jgi:hypothetical protein